MNGVVVYLKKLGVQNVGRFVSRLPPVLGYDVDTNLAPKVRREETRRDERRRGRGEPGLASCLSPVTAVVALPADNLVSVFSSVCVLGPVAIYMVVPLAFA